MFLNNSIKFIKIHINSQPIRREISSCTVLKDWKRLIQPIRPHVPDTDDTEEFLKAFKSSKGISSDVMRRIPKEVPMEEVFSFQGMKKIYNNIMEKKILFDQRFIDRRVNILGPDLAAAHFLVHRGGKVLFKNWDHWMERDEDYKYELPSLYDETYLVEGLDISNMTVIYDGLQNFENLNYLKIFRASNSKRFNDWSMDRICDQFSEHLEELDISHNPLITDSGLEIVCKLRFLKKLNVTGLSSVQNLQLVCLLLEDALPNLEIEGVSYVLPEDTKLEVEEAR